MNCRLFALAAATLLVACTGLEEVRVDAERVGDSDNSAGDSSSGGDGNSGDASGDTLGGDAGGDESLGDTVVNLPPTADAQATPTQGPAPLMVSFDATGSSDADGSITTYAWDFGDGSAPGSGATPTHSYDAAGDYSATLTVTDDAGAQASDIVLLTVGAEVPTVAAWVAYSEAPGSYWTDSTWGTRSFRIALFGSELPVGANSIAVRLHGRSVDPYTIERVSIAQRDGATLDAVDSTFTEVTFGASWNAGATVPANCSVTSDPIAYDLAAGSDTFISFWAVTPTLLRDGVSQTATWTIDNTDHSTLIDWGGLTIVDTRTSVYAVELVAAVGSRGEAEPMLLGHWPLDEASGPRLDASGRGNVLGDTGGVGSAVAIVGDGATFDGTHYLAIGDSAQSGLDGHTALTMSAWMRPDDLTAVGTIASKYSEPAGMAYRIEHEGGFLQSGLSRDGSNRVFITGTTPLTVGTWYHVALVFDSCAATQTLYLDGVLEATGPVAYSELFDSPATFAIGTKFNASGSYEPFTGMIDDVRLHASALTQAQVQALMAP